MTEIALDLPNPEATAAFGAALAGNLSPGQIVFLEGELGAGKTTLVRAVLAALGWEGPVRSPSYALIHSYNAIVPKIHHLDLYRLGSADEAIGLDLDDYLHDGGILLIEWADRLEGALRPDLTVSLEITGPDERRARVSGRRMPILALPSMTKEQ